MVFCPAAVVYHRHSATLRAYVRKKLIIGYWKAQVVRRFPERVLKDSHTPQVMKVQMLLIGLFTFLAAAAFLPLLAANTFCRPANSSCPVTLTLLPAQAASLAVIVLAIFLATTLPFLAKAWRKDRAVPLVAPFMLAVRAASLSLGYGWGVIQPARNLVEDIP
jgi:hypothetical protein